MSKARKNEFQTNIKMTINERVEFDEINAKFFGGTKTTTELGRFLFKVAYQTLATAKVEIKKVNISEVKVNGKTIDAWGTTEGE